MGRNRKEQLLEPHVLRFIEGELKVYQARKKRIEWLTECIAWERPGWNAEPDKNAGGGRPGGRVSDHTARRAEIVDSDSELTDLKRRVAKVELALKLLTEAEAKAITLLYLERRFTAPGAAIHMGYTPAHVYRLKDHAMLQIAVVFGLATAPAATRKDVKKSPSRPRQSRVN